MADLETWRQWIQKGWMLSPRPLVILSLWRLNQETCYFSTGLPIDLFFFHYPANYLFSNLLHTSGPNVSKEKRWNLVLAYNQVANAPYHNTFLQRPEKLNIVEDGDVSGQVTVEQVLEPDFILQG